MYVIYGDDIVAQRATVGQVLTTASQPSRQRTVAAAAAAAAQYIGTVSAAARAPFEKKEHSRCLSLSSLSAATGESCVLYVGTRSRGGFNRVVHRGGNIFVCACSAW